jgi:hypothetical protein
MDTLRASLGDAAFTAGRFDEARALFRGLLDEVSLPDFLTTSAYESVVKSGR